MKKEKRISIISRGKKSVKEMFGINQRRIERTLAAALDRADEEACLCDEKIIQQIMTIGDVVDDNDKLIAKINDLCTTLETKEAWLKKKEIVKKIQHMFNEEVEIEEE